MATEKLARAVGLDEIAAEVAGWLRENTSPAARGEDARTDATSSMISAVGGLLQIAANVTQAMAEAGAPMSEDQFLHLARARYRRAREEHRKIAS